MKFNEFNYNEISFLNSCSGVKCHTRSDGYTVRDFGGFVMTNLSPSIEGLEYNPKYLYKPRHTIPCLLSDVRNRSSKVSKFWKKMSKF